MNLAAAILDFCSTGETVRFYSNADGVLHITDGKHTLIIDGFPIEDDELDEMMAFAVDELGKNEDKFIAGTLCPSN